MSLDLLAALEHLRLKGVRLICFGDFRQLPPVSNYWRGQEVQRDVFEHSRLFHSWAGGRRYVLGRCRRSDQAHFTFYTTIKDWSLEEALRAARARHPPRSDDYDWNLVLSNAKRQQINDRLQRKAAAAHEDKLWIEAADVPFDCFVGTKLVGCNNTHKKIVNGSFLRVTSVSPTSIGLLDEDVGEEQFEVTPEQVAKHTRLRWALTIYGSQGRSLPGTIAVHDSHSRFFSLTHLYVALSRATDGANVSVV